MLFNFRYPDDFPGVMMTILAWSIVGYFFYRIYKKQPYHPPLWKALLVMIIGIFSFTFNFQWLGALIRLPILPLGVWMLYFFLKKKQAGWIMYRPFAWFGFAAVNSIFVISSLLTPTVHQLMYSKDQISTYLSDIDHASLISVHPSAENASLNQNHVLNFERQPFNNGLTWYYDRYNSNPKQEIEERFPYLLSGASSKWGSGYDPVIYVEENGKGILISTPKEQHYFHTTQSLIKEGK